MLSHILLKGGIHRGKTKSIVLLVNLGNSLYDGTSLKAVLPIVYIYAYLNMLSTAYIYACRCEPFFILIDQGNPGSPC